MEQRDPRRPDVAERAGVAELEGTVPAGLIIVTLGVQRWNENVLALPSP